MSTTTRVNTVIVGAGQAGLAVSYFLSGLSQDHVVLEQAAQPGAALLVGSCLAAADLASAQVADPQYRFCIQGDDECVANPWYTGEREKTSISEPVTDPLDRE